MLRSFLLGSAAMLASLAFCGPVRAASAPDGSTVPAATAPAAPIPAAQAPRANTAATTAAAPCVSDLRAFSDQMRKDGAWGGGSDYGYGYPMGGYGYEGGYATGSMPMGGNFGYADMRPGYEVRNLLSSANILARNGQQAACEAVLASTREIYHRYAAEIGHRGSWGGNQLDWQQRQIAGARPVTDRTAAFRSNQLLDIEVVNPQDTDLGSVHDLVISPTTGKIAYLIIGRGGIFGFDETYVPVPWTDFKVTENGNLLVLDTTKAGMSAAPAMDDAQFLANGGFAKQSDKVDAYWRTTLTAKASN
jgi:sporulation protein YlmC with PRC-barrel domain